MAAPRELDHSRKRRTNARNSTSRALSILFCSGIRNRKISILPNFFVHEGNTIITIEGIITMHVTCHYLS